MVDYIGYGHVQDMLEKANPLITEMPWERRHALIQEIIEVVNSYAQPNKHPEYRTVSIDTRDLPTQKSVNRMPSLWPR